jgi:uncharacterized membrane protein YkvA (DUF1232 family)
MNTTRLHEFLARFGRRPEAAEHEVRDGFWSTARRAAAKVPFMDEVVAAYYAALDKRTPFKVRATLFGALGYFVMPADMVPDVLALVGFTDDIAVLTAAIAAVRPHIKDSHREAAREALAEV